MTNATVGRRPDGPGWYWYWQEDMGDAPIPVLVEEPHRGYYYASWLRSASSAGGLPVHKMPGTFTPLTKPGEV